MEESATFYRFHSAVKGQLFVLNTNEIARVSLSSSMDKFATLEPVKLYSSHNNKTLSLPPPLVGRLPSDLHLVILRYLPIPDFFHPTPGAPTPPPHSLNPTSSGKNATTP